MAFHKTQLKKLIEETLREIDLYSEDAVNLILGTIAQESRFGTYLKQLGRGPALGICQMEPNTFKDIVENYLVYKPDLFNKIQILSTEIEADAMVWNLKYAIAMCRTHYLRVPHALPSTVWGYALYWKKYYNTYLGAGTVEEFTKNYKKYVL